MADNSATCTSPFRTRDCAGAQSEGRTPFGFNYGIDFMAADEVQNAGPVTRQARVECVCPVDWFTDFARTKHINNKYC